MGRAFFFSRINARDGERKRIILATLFRRPTRFRSSSHSVRGTLERREIRSFGFDTRANWIPVFDSFASRCPENYARTTIDSFFELHTHSFPSSSSEIFHLPRLRTSGYIGFFESFPRIAILSRCLDVLWKLFFYAIEAWQMGRTMDPLHTLWPGRRARSRTRGFVGGNERGNRLGGCKAGV